MGATVSQAIRNIKAGAFLFAGFAGATSAGASAVLLEQERSVSGYGVIRGGGTVLAEKRDGSAADGFEPFDAATDVRLRVVQQLPGFTDPIYRYDSFSTAVFSQTSSVSPDSFLVAHRVRVGADQFTPYSNENASGASVFRIRFRLDEPHRVVSSGDGSLFLFSTASQFVTELTDEGSGRTDYFQPGRPLVLAPGTYTLDYSIRVDGAWDSNSGSAALRVDLIAMPLPAAVWSGGTTLVLAGMVAARRRFT